MATFISNCSITETIIAVTVKTLDATGVAEDAYELAAVKLNGYSFVDEFHRFIQPQRPVPEMLRQMIGSTHLANASMLTLEDAIDQLYTWINSDSAIIVGCSIPARNKKAGVKNPLNTVLNQSWLDLSRLSTQDDDSILEPRDLRSLLDALQLEPLSNFRALTEAEGIARVFLAFAEQKQWSSETLRLLIDHQDKTNIKRTSKPPLSNTPGKGFDPSILRHFPLTPGVYRMYNARNQLIYVGKAKQLRVRLQSYFRAQAQQDRKTRELVSQIDRIEVEPVGSELEALLLEAKTIKAEQPFFNRLIKNYQRLCYLGISTQHPWPGLNIVSDPDKLYKDETCLSLYGPFSQPRRLKGLMEVLGASFKVRRCSEAEFDRHRDAPCLDYHLGLCNAPCAGLVSKQDYQASVESLASYLAGNTPKQMLDLIQERDQMIETLDFEQAAILQQKIDMLQATQARSLVGVQAIHDLHGALVLPALEPDKKRLCLVLAGAPYSWHTIPEHTDAFFSGWLGAYRAIKHLVETIHTYDSGRGVVYKVDYEETRLIGNWVAKLLENQEHSPETGIWIPFKEQTLRKVLQQLREYSAAKIET